jgi:hypothetical protein
MTHKDMSPWQNASDHAFSQRGVYTVALAGCLQYTTYYLTELNPELA